MGLGGLPARPCLERNVFLRSGIRGEKQHYRTGENAPHRRLTER
jgi:hypothetical protein